MRQLLKYKHKQINIRLANPVASETKSLAEERLLTICAHWESKRKKNK